VSLLVLKDVRGGYGEVDILNGITLSLNAGEILTVAGTNGAGKSTLAKAIVGLLPRVSGTIQVGGIDLTPLPPEKRVRQGIGYVPQVANVFPSLTVLENLQVVTGIGDRSARMAELFDIFPALTQRRHTRAGSLSGGERQQLALARALMPRPALMILDEPTAALAPSKVHESFKLIRSLPKLGVSVFIVEQRARQSLAVSDRGCILDGGRVALEGTASALLADDRAAELYLGRPGESIKTQGAAAN
jgi:ABC-type branched-subunit amino acid transport system ATPase component